MCGLELLHLVRAHWSHAFHVTMRGDEAPVRECMDSLWELYAKFTACYTHKAVTYPQILM